jgi:DNA invertase Pin-like site-specific DNA recombinase
MIIGYARVSTNGQTLDAQHTTLRAAGAEKVFAEKVSGAKTNRRQLQLAIEALSAGDILLVTRSDRLAKIDTRPAQCARHNLRQRRWLQIAS